MATEAGQEQGGNEGQEGGNSWNNGQNPSGGNQGSGVGVRINFLNAGNMRIGDINAMGGGSQGGSGQSQTLIDTEHITTIDDPEYDTAKTRVYYTDGTYADFAWEGEVTEDTTLDDGLFTTDPQTYEYIWTKPIREVHFGTAVTSIGNYAFSRNPTLNSISFERFASVEISGGAFSESYNLTGVNGLCVIKGTLVCVDPSKFGHTVTIPTAAYQIQRIGEFSFVNDTAGKLVSVTIPGNVTIMFNAFNGCEYITDLYLPDMTIYDITYCPGETDYAGWTVGTSYDPINGTPTNRVATIHCSDGRIEHDVNGNWETTYTE